MSSPGEYLLDAETRRKIMGDPVKVKEALDTIPEDQWASIDAAIVEIQSRPAGCFTIAEFGRHRGIAKDAAKRLVNELIEKGTVKVVSNGRGSKPTYYQVVRK